MNSLDLLLGQRAAAAVAGSAPGSTLMCVAPQTCSSADKLMEHSGVLSERAGGEDDLWKYPVVDILHLDIFLWLVKLDLGLSCRRPGAQRSRSRLRQLLLLQHCHTHSASA